MIELLKNKPLVSIIIRTKNEEKWITSCIDAVKRQTYQNIEIIVVDNQSTDKTLQKVGKNKIKTLSIKNFLPGKALNYGIKKSKGTIIVCLSAHCIPVNKNWLFNLIKNLDDSNAAGVYGRQEPLSYSSDLDKRDLLIVFGLDKKIQIKDPFFHNANSAFLKKTWKKFPFDEKVTNIEDRDWGHAVIKNKLNIVYEPSASVYHYHGIHQNLDTKRAKNIVKILETIENNYKKNRNINLLKKLKIAAIIPTKNDLVKFKNKYLIQHTLEEVKKSKLISDIYIATDKEKVVKKFTSDKKISIIKRPKNLSEDFLGITEVLKYCLEYLESKNKHYDCIVCLTENYPFRPKKIIDKIIKKLVNEGFDTVIAGKSEKRTVWLKNKDNELNMIFNGFIPTNLKESNLVMSLFGLCSVTYATNIREKDLFSGKLGIYEVENPISSIEFRGNSKKIFNYKD